MSLNSLNHTLSGERDVLLSFLAGTQAALAKKAAGLSDADARRVLVASGTSISGLIKHAAYVQGSWVNHFFAGQEPNLPWPTEEFVPAEDETIDLLLDRYRQQVARVREIVAAADLDDLNVAERPGTTNLRWIVIHMIEELARHCGHADILREQIDGTTGYP